MATQVKNTQQYAAILAALGTEDKALNAYFDIHPDERPAETTEVDANVQLLVNSGLSVEQARQVLSAQVEAAPEEPKTLTPEEVGEALVAQHGYTFAKGRVYGGTALAEAIVRVTRTGSPEIVQSSGVGRTKALLVTRKESGDVAIQNLTKPV